MKRIKDLGKHKSYWERMNPDAYVLDLPVLLNRQWGRLSSQINDENLIISLRKNGDVIGSVLPAAYLYEYQRKILSSADGMSVAHFSKHGEACLDTKIDDVLRLRGNVVLLDQNARPALGLLNREMTMDFKASASGKVVMTDHLLAYMFNHKSYDTVPEDAPNGIHCYETGRFIPNFTFGAHLEPMKMEAKDQSLSAHMHQVIKGVERPNAHRVIEAVRNTSLTID